MTLIRLNCPASSITGWTRARGRLVTAFLEGYAAEGSSTVFVPEAVKNFESGIMVVCAKNPGKTLDGILEEVQYDVPEGGSEPRCFLILTA